MLDSHVITSSRREDDAEIASFYEHVPAYRTRRDVAFFVEAAAMAGNPVLEVGCGTGRILIPAARAGAEITGLDLSPQLLDICRENVLSEPAGVRSRIQLIQADMRSFDIPARFRLAMLPFRVFNHMLTIDDQLACLTAVHRHLVRGALLILDIHNPRLSFLGDPPIGKERPEHPDFRMPGGRRVERRHKTTAYNQFTQIHDFEIIYDVDYPDGRTKRFVDFTSWRYTFRFEAEHLLARSGFEIENVYADYTKGPYGSKPSPDLIMEARKR